MYPAGFEPAHPKITELESVALDHSAKGTWCNVRVSIPLGLLRPRSFREWYPFLCRFDNVTHKIFPVGVEPTIFRLEGGRLSHLATGTLIFYLLV